MCFHKLIGVVADPSLTNKILVTGLDALFFLKKKHLQSMLAQEGFACRRIGEEAAILKVDYAMDCTSAEYTAVFLACSVLLILWPIGVPTCLFYMMYKVRRDIIGEDKETLQKFDFV